MFLEQGAVPEAELAKQLSRRRELPALRIRWSEAISDLDEEIEGTLTKPAVGTKPAVCVVLAGRLQGKID